MDPEGGYGYFMVATTALGTSVNLAVLEDVVHLLGHNTCLTAQFWGLDRWYNKPVTLSLGAQ